jgi:8-hydroxy-5-deazaflavin:NADPH oxidoreductase
MNVAVIGTGKVGTAVGRALAEAGETVVFGSRSPGKAVEVADGTAVRVTGIRDAIAGSEVVIVAVPGEAVADLARQHGAALDGKLVVDATNNLGGGGPAHGTAAFSAHAPGARYARAFNSLGWETSPSPTSTESAATCSSPPAPMTGPPWRSSSARSVSGRSISGRISKTRWTA